MSSSVSQPLSTEEGQPFSSRTGSPGSGVRSSGFARRLTAPFRAASKVFKQPSSALLDKTAPYFSGIRRFGVSKLSAFWNDPFHTLLNLPWGTFILVFFTTYIVLYLVFAFIYWLQGSCISNPSFSRATFTYALWMSSRVASTLGFDVVHPDANCSFINFCVMIQVIASSLINFIMLGVVFARFSAPFKRASTVRFSKVAVISRHASGYWALTLRVANLRKHQILQPAVRLVVTAVDSITPSYYHHEQLQIEGAYKQLTNLELGFPAHISHVITPDSFLFNLSLLEMDTRMMEVLVFVDGIDAMTSKHMSARIAYSTSDIYMNEQFAPMNLEMRGKHLGLDFKDFDKTVPALDPGLLLDLNEAQQQQQQEQYRGSNNGAMGGLWQLRHQSFRKLAERYSYLGVSAAACAALGAPPPSATMGRSSSSGVVAPALPPSTSPGPDQPRLKGAASSATGLSHPHPLATIPSTPTPLAADSAHVSLLSAEGGHMGLASHVSGVPMSASTSGMPFAVARAAHQPADGHSVGLGTLFGLGGAKHSPNSGGGAWTSTHASSHQGGGPPGSPLPALTGAGSGHSTTTAAAAGATGADANGGVVVVAGSGGKVVAHGPAGATGSGGGAGPGPGGVQQDFVVLPALQRGAGAGVGSAWQASMQPTPTSHGLATGQQYHPPAGGPTGGSDMDSAASGPLGANTTSPLLKPPPSTHAAAHHHAGQQQPAAPSSIFSLTSEELGPSATTSTGPPHNNGATPTAAAAAASATGGATTVSSNPFATMPISLPTSHNATDLSEKPIR